MAAPDKCEDTVYTIGGVEISHPEPGTLQVAKSRKYAKEIAVGLAVFLALRYVVFLGTLPAWSAYAWAGTEVWDPLLLWPIIFVVVSLLCHLGIFEQVRIVKEGDAFVFTRERETIEHNGALEAHFADVAHLEIRTEVPKGEYSGYTSHSLLVVLKSKKVLRICWLIEIPWEWDALWRQFTELAQELADILGVELRYQRYV